MMNRALNTWIPLTLMLTYDSGENLFMDLFFSIVIYLHFIKRKKQYSLMNDYKKFTPQQNPKRIARNPKSIKCVRPNAPNA